MPLIKITGRQLPKAEWGNSIPDPIDYQWIKKIMEYEAKQGGYDPSRGAYGLSNWGYNSRNPKSIDEAINFFEQDFLPKVKDYPMGMRERAGDFLYNTGEDPRLYMLDQYVRKYENMPDGLPNRGSYRTAGANVSQFPSVYSQYQSKIDALPLSERVSLLDQGRDFYYQNINRVNNQPNPAYTATWQPRMNIWGAFTEPVTQTTTQQPVVNTQQPQLQVQGTDKPNTPAAGQPVAPQTLKTPGINNGLTGNPTFQNPFAGGTPSSKDFSSQPGVRGECPEGYIDDGFGNCNPDPNYKSSQNSTAAAQPANQMVYDENTGQYVYPEQLEADRIWMGQGQGSKGQPITGTTNANGEKVGGTGAVNTQNNPVQAAGKRDKVADWMATQNFRKGMVTGFNMIGYGLQNFNDKERFRLYNQKLGSTDSYAPTVYNTYSRGRNEINTGTYAPNLMTPVQFAGMQAPEYYGYAGYRNRRLAEDGLSITSDVMGLPDQMANPDMYTSRMLDFSMNIPEVANTNSYENAPSEIYTNVASEKSRSTGKKRVTLNASHNNPLNIHYGKFTKPFGATQGSPDAGGYIARFNDLNLGIQAGKNLLLGPGYINLTIEEARNRWVSGNPNISNPSTAQIVKAMGSNKRIRDLSDAEKDKLFKLFAQWEGADGYAQIKDRTIFSQGGLYSDQPVQNTENMKRKIRITATPQYAEGGQTIGSQLNYGLFRGGRLKTYMQNTEEAGDDVRTVYPESDRQEATIEVEGRGKNKKGEKIVMPDMSKIYDVKGNEHKNGGVPVKAEGGSYVVSDNITGSHEMQELMGFTPPASKKQSENTWAKILDRKVSTKDYNRLSAILEAAAAGKEVDRFELATAKNRLPDYQTYVSKAVLGNELSKAIQGKPYQIPEMAKIAIGTFEQGYNRETSSEKSPMVKARDGMFLPRFGDGDPIKARKEITSDGYVIRYPDGSYHRMYNNGRMFYVDAKGNQSNNTDQSPSQTVTNVSTDAAGNVTYTFKDGTYIKDYTNGRTVVFDKDKNVVYKGTGSFGLNDVNHPIKWDDENQSTNSNTASSNNTGNTGNSSGNTASPNSGTGGNKSTNKIASGYTEGSGYPNPDYPWATPWLKSNTKKGSTTPTGESSLFDPNSKSQYEDVDYWVKDAKKNGVTITNLKQLQEYVYKTIEAEDPDAIKNMWTDYGHTAVSKTQDINNFADGVMGRRTSDLLKKKRKIPETPVTPTTTLQPGVDLVTTTTTLKPVEDNNTYNWQKTPPTGPIGLYPQDVNSLFNAATDYFTREDVYPKRVKYNPIHIDPAFGSDRAEIAANQSAAATLMNQQSMYGMAPQQFSSVASGVQSNLAPAIAQTRARQQQQDLSTDMGVRQFNAQVDNQAGMYNTNQTNELFDALATLKQNQQYSDAMGRDKMTKGLNNAYTHWGDTTLLNARFPHYAFNPANYESFYKPGSGYTSNDVFSGAYASTGFPTNEEISRQFGEFSKITKDSRLLNTMMNGWMQSRQKGRKRAAGSYNDPYDDNDDQPNSTQIPTVRVSANGGFIPVYQTIW